MQVQQEYIDICGVDALRLLKSIWELSEDRTQEENEEMLERHLDAYNWNEEEISFLEFIQEYIDMHI